MSGDDHAGVRTDLLGDQRQCEAELLVVAGEIRGEVGGVVRLPRPSAFAQVDRIERIAAVGEEIGQRLMEEVVGEAVDIEHRAGHGGAVTRDPRTRLGTADQGRGDGGLPPVRIVAQRDRAELVVVQEAVGLPAGACGYAHSSQLSDLPAGPWGRRGVADTTVEQLDSVTERAMLDNGR